MNGLTHTQISELQIFEQLTIDGEIIQRKMTYQTLMSNSSGMLSNDPYPCVSAYEVPSQTEEWR